MASESSMAIEADFPQYALVDEVSGDVLVAAEDVEGFFVDPEEEPEVVFLRVHEIASDKGRAEDAVLEVVNSRRGKIGEYFVGRVVLGVVGAKSADGRIADVSYQFFGNRCEYPQAAKIWRRWAMDAPIERGEWLQWPTSHNGDWLHVVQNAWFASGRRAARYGVDSVSQLDGAQIFTRSGFFCALGEAVNGPGGYFGSNLDALADCISSSCGEGPPVEIVWRDFRASQEFLDRAFVDSVVGIMREFDVNVVIC